MSKTNSRVISYQKKFRKYGVSPKALKWCSQRAQKQRYEQIVKDLKFDGKTILDVGCGFGDIISFIQTLRLPRLAGMKQSSKQTLRASARKPRVFNPRLFISENALRFEYTGVDIVPEFIEKAKELHPESKFILRDYFKKPLKRKFDIVICCGALNTNVKNNMEYRINAIKKMFANAKEALLFNMAGSYPQRKTAKKSNVWFADSLQITKYCLTLTQKIILRHNYNKREFTVVMFK